VAQEALNNVGRHAQTRQARIRLVFNPHDVCLQVQDQGAGFNVDERLIPPRGWGLAGMRERAEAAGGRLVVRSSPGQGTTVSVEVPLHHSEAPGDVENSYEDHSLNVGG